MMKMAIVEAVTHESLVHISQSRVANFFNLIYKNKKIKKNLCFQVDLTVKPILTGTKNLWFKNIKVKDGPTEILIELAASCSGYQSRPLNWDLSRFKGELIIELDSLLLNEWFRFLSLKQIFNSIILASLSYLIGFLEFYPFITLRTLADLNPTSHKVCSKPN